MSNTQRKRREFLYGDIVQLDYGSGKLHGRIHARFGARDVFYIIKPDPSHNDEFEKNEDLMGYMLPLTGKSELDWGALPPYPWVVASEKELTNIISPAMTERFRKGGLCPRCGDRGYWKMLALFCPYHGHFL